MILFLICVLRVVDEGSISLEDFSCLGKSLLSSS